MRHESVQVKRKPRRINAGVPKHTNEKQWIEVTPNEKASQEPQAGSATTIARPDGAVFLIPALPDDPTEITRGLSATAFQEALAHDTE